MINLLKQFIKYTFVGYLIDFFKKNRSLSLPSIFAFWENARKDSLSVRDANPRCVLIECMQEPNPNWDSYYKLAALLSVQYECKFIALTNYTKNKNAASFLNNYINIDEMASIYKPFDLNSKIKSLFYVIKNFRNGYTLDDGFKHIVLGTNIGDLIYDEYLRIAKKETLRRKDILYLIMSYKATYAFLRYKNIIESNNVTDIISIRDTYTHSSYYRASEGITIWKNRAGPMSSIRKLTSKLNYNHKPFYFEKKHLASLKKKYTKTEIDSKYEKLMLKRSVGNIETGDCREIKLAHSNNEIKSKDDFYSFYSLDDSKKTVVIYAHIFVDAVRYPHSVIFSDHYTWLVETLKYLSKLGRYNIFVKPHPSECLYDLGKTISSVVEDVNRDLEGNITVLDKKVDFSVVKDITNFIITGSGTIAMEAPCEGVKVITAGSSSYENTNAMFRNHTREDYFETLRTMELLPDLTEEQIENSKLGFIWLNDELYVKSKSCIGFEKDLCAIEDFSKLDDHYKTLSFIDFIPLINRMNDDEMN